MDRKVMGSFMGSRICTASLAGLRNRRNGKASTVFPSQDPVRAPTRTVERLPPARTMKNFRAFPVSRWRTRKYRNRAERINPYPASPKHMPKNRKKKGAMRAVGSTPP